MIETYSDLSPDALAPYGFHDRVAACRALQDLAGHNVPDAVFDALLHVLVPALAESADPDRAAANLGRWAGRVGSRLSAYQFLASVPAAVRVLVLVLAASQFFADLLVANPEYLEALTNAAVRGPRSPETLHSDMSRRVLTLPGANGRRDALRRAKGPEVLRIGVRDLLGEASFAETVEQISLFADTCVQLAWRICADERAPAVVPLMTVLAMGKLGGRELNYSSDIDLIFVHDGAADAGTAVKMAECLQSTLSRTTDAGFLFRVDARLRPEGRFGPLSRSLASCRAYYESWAEPWERQALLKVRPVAGDMELGTQFIRMVQPFVYGGRVEAGFVDSIRANKRQLEAKVARAGENDINVKEGVGGIRDVEFSVQLLQLLAGGTNPAVRTGNTLDALQRLTTAGLLTPAERDTFHDGYIFLRDVEHRLQLLDERAVRILPRSERDLTLFARRMGYTDGAAFMVDYKRYTTAVHSLFTRLFYALAPARETPPLREWVLAPNDENAQRQLQIALLERGFQDADTALRLLRQDVAGSEYGGVSPEARAVFGDVAPALLDAAGDTSSPDAALRGLDALAGAMPSRAALWQSLAGGGRLLPRLCRLASDAPALWQSLLTHLEYLDALADEQIMDALLAVPDAVPHTLLTLGAWLVRSRLIVGARDVWELAGTELILHETTQAADVALSGALLLARAETGYAGRFAIVGLGRLGAGEMSYASDADVVYVADDLDGAARVAECVQSTLGRELLPYSARLETDARLRPEGRKGALVWDVDTYKAYYAHAETWERQVLLKARCVAGDTDLGAEFVSMTQTAVYGQAFAVEQEDAIRAMKRRIETERVVHPADVKLGPGGLSDVEWAAQLLQWRFGHKNKRLRVPGTLAALRALRDDALLTQADWETLSDTFLTLSRLRGRHFLHTGVVGDVFPVDANTALLRGKARAVFERIFAAT